MKDKLYCPVRRLEKPEVKIEVKQGNDELINIKADLKFKNPFIEFIKFINKQVIKKD